MKPQGCLPLLFAAVVSLSWIPAAASQSLSSVLVTDPEGDGLPGIDVVRLEAVDAGPTFDLRLGLDSSAQTASPGYPTTAGHTLNFHYFVHFDIVDVASGETQQGTAFAHIWYRQGVASPSGSLVIDEWTFTASVNPPPYSSSTEPTSLPVDGDVQGDHLVWTFSRQQAYETASVLHPDRDWALARPFVQTVLRIGDEMEESWATTIGAAERLHQPVDRAPDDGYAQTFHLQSVGEGVSPSGAPKPAAGVFDNRPFIVFEGDSALWSTPTLGTLSLVTITALGVALRVRLGALLGAFLFTRIAVHEALDHPRRRLLVDILERNPGSTFAELRQESALGSGSLSYHLSVLERHQVIIRTDAAGARRYYTPAQAVLAKDLRPTITVEEALRELPGASAREIAQRTGLGRTGVLYHLKKLEAAGNVRSAKTQRTRRYYPV